MNKTYNLIITEIKHHNTGVADVTFCREDAETFDRDSGAYETVRVCMPDHNPNMSDYDTQMMAEECFYAEYGRTERI